jgi:hypothetical protein
MDIVIQGVTFSHPITSGQSLTIKYRDTALADIPANYVTVSTNVTIAVNPTDATIGDISPDITISGLAAGTYAIYIINNCSGRGVRKDVTLADSTVYVWVEDTYICEQDSVFTQIGQVTGLSSPMMLFYDTTSARVYGVDADAAAGNFFWYDPASFTSSASVNFIPAIIPAGGTNYMFGFAADAPSRRLFACGRDSNGVQVLNIDTGIVQVVVWGCNHTVAPNSGSACGDPSIHNGFPRGALTNVAGTIIGIDKYSATMILLDPATLSNTIISLASIPNYVGVFKSSAPIINRVGDEYWVLNNQGNTTEDPAATKSPNIYRYDLTFSTFLGSINISSHSSIWANGAYWRSAYVDVINNKFYVFDMGTGKMIVVDTVLNTVIYYTLLDVRQGKSNAALGFVTDPITNDLFLQGYYENDPADSTAIKIAYRVDKSTYKITNVYPNTAFSNLARIGATNELHGASPGLLAWGGGIGWNTDGAITKFTK